jgi:hypothetical protein
MLYYTAEIEKPQVHYNTCGFVMLQKNNIMVCDAEMAN